MRFGSLKTQTRFAAESRKTRENAWFSQRFEEIKEKQIKMSMKNEAATARPDKREKTRGFRLVLKERARGNDEKASPKARTRGFRNA